MLGAAGLGDIGKHFPNTDQSIAGMSSLEILRRTRQILANANARPINVDAMVIAEAPKIAPHIPAMRANLSDALQLPLDRISIKATTNEGMGFLGRGEGISVMAVAAVERLPDPTFYPNI